MNAQPILFNKKVLEKHLARISLADIPNYAEKIEEIKRWKKSAETKTLTATKETSVQGAFLTRVFEKVLGYKSFIEDCDEYNLKPEKKTKLDGTTSDAALGYFSKGGEIVKAVLELKDATTDLDTKQH